MRAPAPPQLRTMLTNALKAERLSHALLFAGVDGSGRRATSYALARDLLCLQPVESVACGACNSCATLAALNQHDCDDVTHPDLHLIKPDGAFIKVDDIRNAIEKAWISPLLSKAKVFIVFDAQRMNQSSANALLKSLEEPPPHTFFILITHSTTELLPTIISRCQGFSFPLPTKAFEPSHDHLRVQTLFDERDFDGLHQVIKKASQLSKKGVSGAERRENIQGFIDALMRHVTTTLRQTPSNQQDPLLHAQEALLETCTELRANVKLDLLVQALSIRLSRAVAP